MKAIRFPSILLFLLLFLFACKPTIIEEGTFTLEIGSKEWIPFQGGDIVVFSNALKEMVFVSGQRENYFETVLYDSDQSGFLSKQKDHFGDMEREVITFSTDDISALRIKYLLEKEKSLIAEWDMLHVSIYDSINYKIELKVAVNKSEYEYFGEQFQYLDTITFNDSLFHDVLFWEQLSRPKEIYITKESGVVAFKFDSDSLWILSVNN